MSGELEGDAAGLSTASASARGPLVAPPPVPLRRRVRRAAARFWPGFVWALAAAASAALYRTEGVKSQSLAYSEMVHHDLMPEVDGTLVELRLELGQTVRQGEVIARMDPEEIEGRIAPVRSAIARLEARVAARNKRSGQAKGQAKGEAKGADDNAVQAALCGSSPDRLLLLTDTLTTSQASDLGERETLAEQLARLKPLLEQRLVTGERVDELRLRQSVLDRRIAGRARELRRLDDCLDINAGIELEVQRMALTRLERERRRYDVVAPASGTVESITHRTGEWIRAGSVVAEIVVPRPTRLIAYITDRQVPTVGIGMAATLATRGHEGPTLHGRVVALGARIEQVPLRLRFLPTIEQWGRLVTVEVEPPGASVPGEIYNVSFAP